VIGKGDEGKAAKEIRGGVQGGSYLDGIVRFEEFYDVVPFETEGKVSDEYLFARVGAGDELTLILLRHRNRFPFDVPSVHFGNGTCRRFVIGKGHERESPNIPCVTISWDEYSSYRAEGFEQFDNVILYQVVGEIFDINLFTGVDGDGDGVVVANIIFFFRVRKVIFTGVGTACVVTACRK